MSNITRSNLVKFLTAVALILTTFQGLIPTIPISDVGTITTISAIVMFLVQGVTALKQYLSNSISNISLNPTLVILIVSVLASFIDLLDIVNLGAVTEQWIRFGITFVTLCLNLTSKILYPSESVQNDFDVKYKNN